MSRTGGLAVAFLGVLAACANGGDDSNYYGPGGDGGGGGSAMEGGSGNDAGTGGGSGSGSVGNDGGGIPVGDGGGTSGDGSAPASCMSPDTCSASATNLGTIAGDESGPTETATGATSEWLRIDLQEKDSSIVGHPMKLTATLASPSGANFDLYAYLGAHIGSIECNTVKAKSTNGAGQTDTVSFEWGELNGVANGVDDSATVMLQVVWVSGTCGAGATWSLSAHGN
jgi:hypothetical protein